MCTVPDKTYRRPEAGVYEHNGNCSAAAIMLAYCVFNASSAAVSLYQPLLSH